MTRLKLTFIIVASLAALALLAVVLAFTPGVQTWAVRRALAGQPGLVLEVGRVAAGLSSAELHNVRVVQDGTVIVVKEISAAYSATDYLSGKKINVSRVAVKGAEVDTRKSTAKPAASPAKAAVAPFAGILNAIRLPGEVSVGRIEVDAKVLLPDEQTVTLNIEGGGIAPGQIGKISWTVSFTDAGKSAALKSAQAAGDVKLRTTSDLRIDLVEVTADAGATGPGIPADRVKLDLKLEQATPTSGESIGARVSLVRGAAVEPLLNVKVDYVAGKPVMSGGWDLAVRSEQLGAVLAGFGLPEVTLAGKGQFTYNLDSGAATTAGEVTGKISNLEKLGAELASIGALQVRTAFEGGSSKESAQLGRLEFEVAAEDGRKFVTVAAQQKLSFNFKDKRLTPERPGAELARVSLISVPLAWAQSVVKPRTISSGDISGVFVVEAELDGSRVKARALEPLTLRSATIREGTKLLVDRVTVSLSPRVDYTATRVVADIEKISVSTADGDTLLGAVSADIALGGAAPVTAFSAELKGRLAALVKPYLPADVGPLTLALSAKGRHEGNALQLAALKVQIDRDGGVALAAIEALQAISVDLAKLQARAPNVAAPAARVRWGVLPLAWAEPYVAQSKLAGVLSAGAIEVTLLDAEAVVVRATEAIALRGATVAMNGQEFIRGADFSTDLNATWKAGTVTADIKRLDLRQGDVSLLTASVAGEAVLGKVIRAKGRGQLDADFAALAKQPALAAQLPLARGAVTVKFEAAAADDVKAKINIIAKNLVARSGARALGSMELSIDAALDANNAGPVRIPLVVTKDGRRSDILLDGRVGLKAGAISFDGRIGGDQLIVDDLQAFAVLGELPPSTSTALVPKPAGVAPVSSSRAATTTAPVARAPQPTTTKLTGPIKDTSPVWAGFTGRVDLNFKTIKLDAATTLGDLRGALAVRDDRLAVENISGKLNGNIFKVSTLLSFDSKLPRPYALVGTVDIPGFDVGDFLRKADPSAPPALETTFTIATKFNGTAANLPEFADRIQGQFDFKGSKGVLRALNKKAETTSLTTGLLGLAAGLAGQQKLAAGLTGAAELAQLLKDMQFDGITVLVERGVDAAIVVKTLEVLSPMMRLTGTGRIDSKPGMPFANSPLSLTLQLAAKGQLANGLNQARQLDGKTDDKGYYLMATPFALAGTVEKPDSSDFWKNLTLNTAGGFLR